MSTLLYRGRSLQRQPQRLYPALWLAAASVTIFSLLGIISMSGVWPTFSGRSEVASVSAPVAPRPAPAAKPCSQCGVVESVVGVDRSGSGVGALIGALGGAVLGNSFGQGNGGEAMTLIGGVTGAQAGSEIEQRGAKPEAWQIRVRMDDGTLHTINSRTQPEWQSGTRVRLDGEQLIPLPEK